MTVMNASAALLAQQRAKRDRVWWLAAPVAIVLILLPGLIALNVRASQLAGALLAYINVLLASTAMVYFVKRRAMEALIPVMFLTWPTLGWGLGSIYFAITHANMYYVTVNEEVRRYMDGAVRLQSVFLVFQLIYIPIMFLALRRSRPSVQPDPVSARRMAALVLWIALIAIGFNASGKIIVYPSLIDYVSDGLYLYFNGLLFVVGVLFFRLPFHTRVAAVLLMLLTLAFYSIGNARGMAVLPFALFAVGLLFLGGLSPRWKIWMILGLAVGFPLFMVISNTTRMLGAGLGYQNLSHRLELMGRWQEVVNRQPVLASTFGRLFSTGGHTIITLTPERYPYLAFDPGLYAFEFFTHLLIPGRIYNFAHYATPMQLKRYDLRITKKTSIELSFLGSLWMLGGWTALVCGTVAIAGFHAWVARYFRRMQARYPCRAVFLFSVVCTAALWGPNLDFINHVRQVLWNGAVLTLVYFIAIRGFVNERRHAPESELAPPLPPAPPAA